jgi:hypothetical protein
MRTSGAVWKIWHWDHVFSKFLAGSIWFPQKMIGKSYVIHVENHTSVENMYE